MYGSFRVILESVHLSYTSSNWKSEMKQTRVAFLALNIMSISLNHFISFKSNSNSRQPKEAGDVRIHIADIRIQSFDTKIHIPDINIHTRGANNHSGDLNYFSSGWQPTIRTDIYDYRLVIKSSNFSSSMEVQDNFSRCG